SRVQRSGAKFEEQRLDWVNGHFIRQKPLEALYKMTEPFWPKEAKASNSDYKKTVLGLVQERLKYLSELPDLTWFFFREPTDEEVKAQIAPKDWPKTSTGQIRGNRADSTHLKATIESLRQSDFSYDDIKSRLNDLLQSLNTHPVVLFSEIRGATTGAKVSPELFGSLNVLGKDKVLARLQRASQLLKA
ncbi:MAG TPA: hypothetical protein VFK97_03170, partial [Candidatus Saccharimonadales bacterium]|nr:hypothetical protein [Candidatus Saccharimonadales bacterium]